ncbi:hypothetical protein K438DRAFT_1842917 [Mycena galopus ATCC 62051]|nr:hypothetical protein K438DRAFT_1842917 [Mycena galopus ATCC 62051]
MHCVWPVFLKTSVRVPVLSFQDFRKIRASPSRSTASLLAEKGFGNFEGRGEGRGRRGVSCAYMALHMLYRSHLVNIPHPLTVVGRPPLGHRHFVCGTPFPREEPGAPRPRPRLRRPPFHLTSAAADARRTHLLTGWKLSQAFASADIMRCVHRGPVRCVLHTANTCAAYWEWARAYRNSCASCSTHFGGARRSALWEVRGSSSRIWRVERGVALSLSLSRQCVRVCVRRGLGVGAVIMRPYRERVTGNVYVYATRSPGYRISVSCRLRDPSRPTISKSYKPCGWIHSLGT